MPPDDEPDYRHACGCDCPSCALAAMLYAENQDGSWFFTDDELAEIAAETARDKTARREAGNTREPLI